MDSDSSSSRFQLSERLQRHAANGLTVNSDGLVSNYIGFPPAVSLPSGERTRSKISDEDVELCRKFVDAAIAAGETPEQGVEMLARVHPSRSKTGWRSVHKLYICKKEARACPPPGSDLQDVVSPARDILNAGEQTRTALPPTDDDSFDDDSSNAIAEESVGEFVPRPTSDPGRVAAEDIAAGVEARSESDEDSHGDGSDVQGRTDHRSKADLPHATKGRTDDGSAGRSVQGAADQPMELVVPRTKLSSQTTSARTQMKGIIWQTAAAYDRFNQLLRKYLARWGVNEQHDATCILISGAWAYADPMQLMQDFSRTNCPIDARQRRPAKWQRKCDHVTTEEANETGSYLRLSYRDGDHTCSFTRALCWFRKEVWPPNGARFDRFMRLYGEVMEGSHLCHQAYCINPNHLVWEPKMINYKRNECSVAAFWLRQSGRPIPEGCSVHDPPCKMRLAALRPMEVYWIQFSVMCSSLEVPCREFPTDGVDPQTFPTIEMSLPLKDPNFGPDTGPRPEGLITKEEAQAAAEERPLFTCSWCINPYGYTELESFLAHMYHAHKYDRPLPVMVEEFRVASARYVDWQDKQIKPTLTSRASLVARRVLNPQFTGTDIAGLDLIDRTSKGKGKPQTRGGRKVG